MQHFLAGKGYVRTDIDDELNGYYLFKDNKADTLAVAHMDTVFPSNVPMIYDGKIYSPGVDNRIGVYIIDELLAKKNIKCDILFTTNEERLMSSGRAFRTEKKYNFIFSFDRMGDDIAMYQYLEHGDKFNAVLEDSGFKLSRGSYSDIADLQLGCKGMNVGIGYNNNPHSLDAYVDLEIVINQLNKFYDFWQENHKTKYVHKLNNHVYLEELLVGWAKEL